jgi:hypothetical protein
MLIGTKDFLRSIIVCSVASFGMFWKVYSCAIALSLIDILITVILAFFSVTVSVIIISISLVISTLVCIGSFTAILFLYYKLVCNGASTENTSITYDSEKSNENTTLSVKFGLICGTCFVMSLDTVAFIVVLLCLII